MTAAQTMEWIRFVEELRQRLPPEMVQRVVVLAAERDEALTQLQSLSAAIDLCCGANLNNAIRRQAGWGRLRA